MKTGSNQTSGSGRQVAGGSRFPMWPVARTLPHASGRGRPQHAFSLIEIIGVLAVITIMALAIAPALLAQLDKAAKDTESSALQQLATGLQRYVTDARRIPGPGNDFVTNVASELGWLVSEVSTNARRNPRYYLVDPALAIGTNAGAGLPYKQGILGSTNPVNARVMIVSSMGGALPAAISTPTLSATDFNNLWEGAEGSTPAGWTYGGKFQDIKIQRLNLTPMFVELNLNNNSPLPGHYTIDSVSGSDHIAVPWLPGTNAWTASFLQGTVLWLHGNDGTLQTKQILAEDSSFYYENGVWRGKFFNSTAGQLHNGADLQGAYEIFMSGPPNVYHVGSVNQSSLTVSMYIFMSNYVYWATSSPAFSSSRKAAVSASQSDMSSQLGTYCDKKASIN